MLGDAVTPEVHAAWSEVYWLFATLLIAEEARLYHEAACDPAVPYRTWRVTERFESVAPGDELELSRPFGDVVVDDGDDPLVLVSAGIGITPAAAIIDRLAAAQPGRRVLAVHADRSPRTHPLREQIARAGRRMPGFQLMTWYEDLDGAASGGAGDGDVRPGRIDVSALPLPPKARVFMCGPIPFMREIRRGLADAGISDERVHYEVFGPDLWNKED
ncbi:hypothetical protein [Actinomadura sp. 7K507]|uniref:hypothetical protein n=1 Tax=Actinomadura sp. 7K507 TaxID=2530365 RepID=UPI0014049A09|nr:hypothetical protein [Actinomadura sp. 7K507]